MNEKIKIAIEKSEFTKRDICKMLDISRPTMDSVISGNSSMPSNKLLKLSEITGFSLDYFFDTKSDFNLFRGGPCL